MSGEGGRRNGWHGLGQVERRDRMERVHRASRRTRVYRVAKAMTDYLERLGYTVVPPVDLDDQVTRQLEREELGDVTVTLRRVG